MADLIRVEGLAEFARNLKRLDAKLPKALRLALNQAADVIVETARPQVPRRSGRAAASIRSRSTRTLARVTAGGDQAPYYAWLDFGGRVGRKGSVRRYFLKEGRYLYKAYFAKRRSGEFERVLATALSGVAEDAGFRVT